ncbi:MAG: DUF1501 domain-containing protein [Planctomycetaceae bacterium]|nr:DUF1501 domain-containing protein [Planctomycetaceae bacterium]
MGHGRTNRATRRQCLQLGTLGVAGWGLSLPRLLQAETAAPRSVRRPQADHAILLFLDGGPSHLDMWDMKPNAPDGIRGEFHPISTSLPGYQLCEHLPRLSQHMHRATVVRSMHHTVNNSHGAAVYTALTGHDRGEVGGLASPNDHPHMGAVLAKLRPAPTNMLSHVHLPYITQEGAGNPPQPGFFAGFLGRSYDPLFVLTDPNAPNFSIPELTLQSDVTTQRLAIRRQLFGSLDDEVPSSAMREVTAMQGRALDLLSSERAQQAFRLTDETEADRARYGRNVYGQSVLLGRRLIEAGTRLVTVSWAPNANATWDTHGSNFASLKNTLLPQLDAACSSLVGDLADRGMLERTIVAVFGDFGRTPRINGSNAGRDHWNYCYSLMMIGGGFRPGHIHGSSDATGAFPASLPLTPGDIIATMYHALGVPHDGEVRDNLNRPHRIVPIGEPVLELLT